MNRVLHFLVKPGLNLISIGKVAFAKRCCWMAVFRQEGIEMPKSGVIDRICAGNSSEGLFL